MSRILVLLLVLAGWVTAGTTQVEGQSVSFTGGVGVTATDGNVFAVDSFGNVDIFNHNLEIQGGFTVFPPAMPGGFASDGFSLYIAMQFPPFLLELEPFSGEVLNTIPLPEGATGLTFDSESGTLWAVIGNEVVEFDPDTGIPTGRTFSAPAGDIISDVAHADGDSFFVSLRDPNGENSIAPYSLSGGFDPAALENLGSVESIDKHPTESSLFVMDDTSLSVTPVSGPPDCPGVSDLNCVADSETMSVSLSWTNNAAYSLIRVNRLNNLGSNTTWDLPGGTTSFTESGVPFGLFVYGVSAYVGTTQCSGNDCLVFLPKRFVRGDCIADGQLEIADALFLLNYLFVPLFPVPVCLDACDADDNGVNAIADALYILYYLFSGGAFPPPPFPLCGEDLTTDSLGCSSYPPCL